MAECITTKTERKGKSMDRSLLRKMKVIIVLIISSFGLNAQSIYDQLAGRIDIVVDKSGGGDFTTIREAIDSIPDNNDTWKVIFLKKGIYYEKIVLGYKKTKVILIGEDVDSTIITYDDNAGVYKDTLGNGHTFSTYTFRADANDFQAFNLTFRNNAYETRLTGDQQGVAFHSNGDRQLLYHCRLLGYQDTYFDNFRTRRYIKDCFIEGAVDYIFGFGVTLFDSCQIHTSRSTAYITAASTPQYYEFGYVFENCRLTNGPNVSGISLGRPWFDWANVVYDHCWEPQALIAGGWTPWAGRENTCFYREYECFGPGSDTTNRVFFGKQLDPAKADRYVKDTIFTVSNFPTYLGYTGDTAELMKVYRRFEVSGYPERADTILYAGRDHYPEYPTDKWSPQFDEEIFNVVQSSTWRMMDSVNGILEIDKILLNGSELKGFNPEITEYGVELDENDTVGPVITVTGEGVTFLVDYPESVPGYAKVTVLSRDKVNGNTYSIYFSKDSAYWDTGLKFVVVNGTDTVRFEPGNPVYNLKLQPGETKVKSVIIYTKISGQRYSYIKPATLPGTIEIDITALDKVTTQQYLIHVDLQTGINKSDVTAPDKISILNPVKNELLIINRSDQPADAAITICDLNGKLLFSETLHELITGISETGLDVSSLSAGIYLYRINLNEQSFFGKIIKTE